VCRRTYCLLTIVRLFPKVCGEDGGRQTMMKYEGI